MQAYTVSLLEVLKQVRNLQEAINAYCLAPDKIPVSRDDLIRAIQEVHNYQVNQILASYKAKYFPGSIEVYDGYADIYLESENTDKNIRFILFKELFHIALMKEGNITADDPTATIEYFIQNKWLDELFGPMPPVQETEKLAEYGAMELLFPRTLRLAERLKDRPKEVAIFDVSSRYLIPEHIAELMLSDHYHQCFESLWLTIHNENNA